METQPAAPRSPRRTPLIGAVLALAVGVTAGGLLKAGDLFSTTAPVATAAETASADDGVMTFMTDADGRVPDYVVGTDVTVGAADTGFQSVAYEPDATPAMTAEDWSTAPSMSGDILAMGGSNTASQPLVAAPSVDSHAIDASVDSHAIDASEVAASGATSRAERKPVEAEPAQSAADRRDGQAALASAGFTTTTP